MIDIFSRTWGDQFERAEVTPLSRLPTIQEKDFADYLTKLSSRVNRKHLPSSPRANVLLQAVRSSAPFRSHPTHSTSATIHNDPTDHLRSSSLDIIPPMFFDLDFNLQQCKTFCQVIPFHSRLLPGDSATQDLTSFGFPLDDRVRPTDNKRRQQQHDFNVQHERLVHYLDIVEVHLADHVSKKSSIFCEAVCCHDVVRDQLSDALDQIRLVRNKMRRVDTSVTYAALRLHRLVRRRANYRILLQKLKIIASLQAAQPTIQMLLRSNDFCAALDLVASTQDLLVLSSSTSDDHLHATSDPANSQFRQLTCLRHLNAQLTEISRFVRHMIEAEFEAALCQFMEPRASCSQYVEPDLVPCLLGLLHIKRHDFVSAFRAELIRQVKRTQQQHCTSVDSTVQESIKPSISIKERLRHLSNEAWLQLIADRCTEFQALLSRAEEAASIFTETMHRCTAQAGYRTLDLSGSDTLAVPDLSLAMVKHLTEQLRSAILSASENAQKHIVDLVSARLRATPLTDAANASIEKSPRNVAENKWGPDEFAQLVGILERFQDFLVRSTWSDKSCEADCSNQNGSTPCTTHFDDENDTDDGGEQHIDRLGSPRTSVPRPPGLLTRLLIRLTRSCVTQFHAERADKLETALNQERWHTVPVPSCIQQLANRTFGTYVQNGLKSTPISPQPPSVVSVNCSKSATIISSEHEASMSTGLLLGGERFVVVGTVLLLLPIIADYVDMAKRLPCQPWSVIEVTSRLADLLNSFNSRTCQLVLGAEARRTADLPTISARNLALASRSLQLVLYCITIMRTYFESLLASNKNHQTAIEYSVPKERRQHNVLQHVENLFREHVDQINDKLFNLLSNRIQDRLSVWVVRPPTPSAELRAICRALSRLCEMNADVMPTDQLTPILLRAHNEFKTQLRHRLSELAVVADGGPKQSLVDSELTYYMNQLRSLTPQLSKFSDDFADVWPTS
ncbi:hypothetical protein EG68_03903 [Paragonimus skrjabini miyazakii]|uniref:Vacuolar protein sorting-associated protein 54 n=1 Tax=Paragonimus skrjabini miyazakii TaxID=59628 RepID=A0A8S9YFE9_9TREM|nr:hypothetical protein EG68_03903 [Paragonimus skrjabini miyazakii]